MRLFGRPAERQQAPSVDGPTDQPPQPDAAASGGNAGADVPTRRPPAIKVVPAEPSDRDNPAEGDGPYNAEIFLKSPADFTECTAQLTEMLNSDKRLDPEQSEIHLVVESILAKGVMEKRGDLFRVVNRWVQDGQWPRAEVKSLDGVPFNASFTRNKLPKIHLIYGLQETGASSEEWIPVEFPSEIADNKRTTPAFWITEMWGDAIVKSANSRIFGPYDIKLQRKAEYHGCTVHLDAEVLNKLDPAEIAKIQFNSGGRLPGYFREIQVSSKPFTNFNMEELFNANLKKYNKLLYSELGALDMANDYGENRNYYQ